MGAGILAAGPWNCAETVLLWPPVVTATQVCSHTAGFGTPFLGPPDHEASIAATKRAAQAGSIDAPEFLAKARVYLFSEINDSLVPPSVVDELQKYYVAFGGRLRIRTKITHKLNYRGCCLLGVRGAMNLLS